MYDNAELGLGGPWRLKRIVQTYGALFTCSQTHGVLWKQPAGSTVRARRPKSRNGKSRRLRNLQMGKWRRSPWSLSRPSTPSTPVAQLFCGGVGARRQRGGDHRIVDHDVLTQQRGRCAWQHEWKDRRDRMGDGPCWPWRGGAAAALLALASASRSVRCWL